MSTADLPAQKSSQESYDSLESRMEQNLWSSVLNNAIDAAPKLGVGLEEEKTAEYESANLADALNDVKVKVFRVLYEENRYMYLFFASANDENEDGKTTATTGSW